VGRAGAVRAGGVGPAGLTADIAVLEREIAARVRVLAPSLLALTGVAELTAARIVA